MSADVGTDAAADVTAIEHLDFEPPCDITANNKPCCGQSATWAVLLRRHCADETRLRLWCDDHFHYATTGGFFVCTTCGDEHAITPSIVSAERLRP